MSQSIKDLADKMALGSILFMVFVLAFIVPFPLTAKEKPPMTDQQNTIRRITYHFSDSSVPPQYHRSYTLTVTPEKINVTVDSYGDILAQKDVPITPKQFDEIVRSLKKHNIRHTALGEDDGGCTGGTSESVSYSDGEKELFSASVYHCGRQDTGNLGGDVKGFADDIKKCIKGFGELLI